MTTRLTPREILERLVAFPTVSRDTNMPLIDWVQDYLASVEGYGERALVWIDGEVTHSVRKTPRWEGQDEHVSEAMPVSAAEAELASIATRKRSGEQFFADSRFTGDQYGSIESGCGFCQVEGTDQRTGLANDPTHLR